MQAFARDRPGSRARSSQSPLARGFFGGSPPTVSSLKPQSRADIVEEFSFDSLRDFRARSMRERPMHARFPPIVRRHLRGDARPRARRMRRRGDVSRPDADCDRTDEPTRQRSQRASNTSPSYEHARPRTSKRTKHPRTINTHATRVRRARTGAKTRALRCPPFVIVTQHEARTAILASARHLREP